MTSWFDSGYAAGQEIYELIGFRSQDNIDYVEMTCDCSPPYVGTIVDIYRLVGSSQVKVGYVKVEERSGAGFIARVLQNGTTESEFLLEDYPRLMSGDLGVSRKVRISRVLQLTPTQQLSYYDLFEDPLDYPKNYRLTDLGRQRLREATSVFLESKVSKLFIEAHTDTEGQSDENLVESKQRAMIVKQYLINEFGFDPKRLVAIGMGESEPIGKAHLPGSKRLLRRIVIKAK